MTSQEAVTRIIQKAATAINLSPDDFELNFAAEKLVLDILDYCHREDFPETLIFTCVDLIRKRLADLEAAAANSIDSDTNLINLNGVSEIKMDDTSFKFSESSQKSTSAPNNAGLLSDLDFDSIKPRLNLYRKLVSA